MIKDIKFNGYSVEPSDYECPDGSLAASLNLIAVDSQIKPAPIPRPIMSLSAGSYPVLIHKVDNQTNLLILRDGDLLWMPMPDDTSVASDTEATLIKHIGNIHDISIIGNTIAIAAARTEYLLWRDGAYHPLGSKPAFTTVEFGCRQVDTLGDSAELTVANRRAGDRVLPATDPQTSNAVYGLMLPAITEKVTSKGYVYMPFFVRYAYRLYDGSYCWHSAPILMLPSVIIPQVLITATDTHDAETMTVNTKLNIPYFQLLYKITGVPDLSAWSDIISSIDVFISAPIYTYDQSASIHYISDTRSQLLAGYCDYNPNHYDPRSGLVTVPDYIFSGHYADMGTSSFTDHKLSTASADSQSAWTLTANEQFHDQIKSCNGGNFYHVASLPLSSFQYAPDFKPLPLTSSDMGNLATRERMPDDYQSHHTLSPKTAFTYNSRLCLAGITVKPPVPFNLASSVETASVMPGSPPPANVQIQVFSRLAGIRCYNSSTDYFGNTWDIDGHFPRYLYYPDSSAYKINLRYGGQDHFLDLTPHDFLNGAYYYGAMPLDAKPSAFADPVSADTDTSVDLGNKVYVSEINNPFTFPARNIVTVGSGSIRALAAVTKALSQGQFGQFPLYAFTTEGVWALEVSSTGTFSARQPISRDVILDGTKPLQMDSSVLFATDRGIMQLAGSQTSCISDIINNVATIDLAVIPAIPRIHSMIHNHDDACLCIQPFSSFIEGCGMLYDYTHQRAVVFNKAFSYAYVYSLKSQQWGMLASTFRSGLNSYPGALAVSHDGSLLDLSCNQDPTPSGLLITRPIKLETPDVIKTADTVIIRGRFAKGHVQSVLYGSRDLVNWHIVWSSRDHYLRGFRGSGYKYFRIACLATLDRDESIFGASIQYTPRLTDQPR